MSGWVDPLGLRTLLRFLYAEDERLKQMMTDISSDGRIGEQRRRRRLAKVHARLYEIRRVNLALAVLSRPGNELQPYKALVQDHADERRIKIEALPALLSNWSRGP